MSKMGNIGRQLFGIVQTGLGSNITFTIYETATPSNATPGQAFSKIIDLFFLPQN